MTDKEILQFIEQKIASHSFVPVGAIFAFPSEKIPEGYLPCEGQELSRVQYPELFNLIGFTFGGDSKTFCLPDLQGQFIRGLDREGNLDYDEDGSHREIGSVQQHSFQGHSHSADVSRLEISSVSGHDHDLYWAEFKVRDYSINGLNNHDMWFAMPYGEKDNRGLFGRNESASRTKDGTTIEGAHNHSVSLKGQSDLVGAPISSSYGSVDGKVSSETRPINMALIFCIKVV